MEQEASDELVGAECHCAVPRLPVAAVVLVAEGHAAFVERNEASVRDGDTVCVAGEVGEYRLRPGEGRLGVDEPVLPLEWCEICVEGLAATQTVDLAKEREPARCMGVGKRRQEQPPEQARKHRHRQEKAGLAGHPARPPGLRRGRLERYPTTRHNHMHVRMVGHCRAPAVEHGGGADTRAEVLGIGGDCEQRFRRRAEQQVVDDSLVLIGDWRDLGGQCEDHVEIADGQQFGLAFGEPFLRRRALTLWAMAVATRVVGDAAVATILAALDMPAERGRAALLDRRHDLELTQAHMPGIGSAPVGSMAMKDVCDLQPRAAHRHLATCRVAASPRPMMPAGRVGWLRSGSSYWRRGCTAPSCRAWRDPEVFESHEYRHLVRANAWRSCAAAYVARRAS